jgi:hypothetical protein
MKDGLYPVDGHNMYNGCTVETVISEYFSLVSKQRQLRNESRRVNRQLNDAKWWLENAVEIPNEMLYWQAN